MDEIMWETPPPDVLFRAANRGGKYVDLALALKQRPGDWARMPAEAATTDKSAQALAAGIRAGRQRGFTKGEYEAVREGATVWVRALPPEAVQAPGNGSDDDPPDDEVDPVAVRAWARENGWPDLGPRGRIAGEILDAWRARPGAHLSSVRD